LEDLREESAEKAAKEQAEKEQEQGAVGNNGQE
jgi:hypothetical protein